MYVSKTPAVVKALYSSMVWNMPRNSNTVYLTFDDGPHPEITTQVLATLNAYNAKASFFCVGQNIERYPLIFAQLSQQGHAIGNHTFHHLNGWKTLNFTYFRNFIQCQRLMRQTHLFRPPYGKISRQQAQAISQKSKIIMWDVLSGDFDKTISKEKCLDNVIKNIRPGSIVVFHDSEKAADKMMFALPKVLDFTSEKKWSCATL